VTIAGRVRDSVADVVPGGAAAIPHVNVLVNGTEVDTIPLGSEADGPASLVRPYPYVSTRFLKTVTFPTRNGSNTVVVKTAENVAGRKGMSAVELLVARGSEQATLANLPPLLGAGLGNLTFNVVVPAPFDPQTADTIRFYVGDRAPADHDKPLQETDVASLTFEGPETDPPAVVHITQFAGLTAGIDTLQATVDLELDGTSTLRIDATFTETEATSGRFAFTLGAASLAYNLHFSAPCWSGTLDSVAFYLGNRSQQAGDPRLAETAVNSLQFTGPVNGLGQVTVTLQTPPTLDVSVTEALPATIAISAPSGSVTLEAVLRETTRSSSRFFFLGLAQDETGHILAGQLDGIMRHGPPRLIDAAVHSFYGRGHVVPILVRSTFPPGEGRGHGTFLESEWQLVGHPDDPWTTSHHLYLAVNGKPAVFLFTAQELDPPAADIPNVKQVLGKVVARLTGSPEYGRRDLNVKVSSIHFRGGKDSIQDWSKPHDWGDILLVSTTENRADAEDSRLYIEMKVDGLPRQSVPQGRPVWLFSTTTLENIEALPELGQFDAS